MFGRFENRNNDVIMKKIGEKLKHRDTMED